MNNNENTTVDNTVDNWNDVLGNKEIANNYTGGIWNLFKDDVNNVYLKRKMYTLSFNRKIRRNPNDAYYFISVILNSLNKKVNSSIFGRDYRNYPNRIRFIGFYERSDVKLNDHVHYFIRIPKDFNNSRRIRFIINKIKYFTRVLITREYWEYSNYSLDVKIVKDSKDVLLSYMSKKYNKNTNDNLIIC
jgi:hypothetical protein